MKRGLRIFEGDLGQEYAYEWYIDVCGGGGGGLPPHEQNYYEMS